MSTGKQITIYLDSGVVTGLRHAQLINWSGQAVACPRGQVKILASWEEAQRPGVYFLYGDDPETAEHSVYIGEAENIYSRLQNHLANKEFWNEVIFFTSKDDNLTKAHVKYLESRLVRVAKAAGRHPLLNGNEPQAPKLPRGDLAAMDEFVGHARTLLGVLGQKTLEPLAVPATNSGVGTPSVSQTITAHQTVFCLSGKGIEAKSIQSNEGIVVLEGSGFSPDQGASLSPGNKRLREHLQTENIIGIVHGVPRFLKSHVFSSPSQAASVIFGSPTNGRQAWKSEDGRSIADDEESGEGGI